jgi:hypothetical protein
VAEWGWKEAQRGACQKEGVCGGSDNCQGIGIMDMMRKGLLGRAYISTF